MTDENATLVEDASEESTESEVSEDVAGDTGESTEEVIRDGFVSDRQKAMDAIIETRRQEVQDEIETTDNTEVESERKDEPRRTEDSPISFNGEQWVTTVKIDGNEIEVPFDSLRSSHQKDQASQKRFEEAALYARQLKEREHQMHAYAEKLKAAEQQLRARAQPQPPKGAEKSVPSDKDELVKKYHEALYEDDAAKAAELFNALTNSGRNTATPDINKVVDSALNRAIASRQEQDNQRRQMEYNMALDEAVSWFNSEYDDIASTPELRAIADSQTVTLTRENPGWTPRQVIKEAAEYTRKWVNKNSRPSADERIDRKKKIVKQPRSASASSPSTDEELPPQTATQVIEDMRRARGQL